MRKRYLYSILIGVPGLVISVIISVVAFGVMAGVLWIFVFGDNPWPTWVEGALPIFLVVAFLAVWGVTIAAGYAVGKRLEANPTVNNKHIAVSVGLTVLLALFILLYQLGVGNLGTKSDGTRCSEYCSQQGYSASSVPAQNTGQRTCSCLDSTGNEIITVPLDGK